MTTLLALAGGAGFIWSKVSTSNALVAVASDVGRPGANAVHVVTEVATDNTYRVAVAIPDDCRAGFDCEVMMTILPAEGWHTNLLAPLKFRGKDDGELAFSPSRVEKHDGTATVHVRVRPRAPGAHRVAGVLRVYLCNANVCRNANHDVAISLPTS